MKKLGPVLILFVLMMPGLASATAQFPDNLIYNGEKLYIFSNPLESFFDEKNLRPDDLFIPHSTACWRGYIGTWKIEDGYLYLVKLMDCAHGSESREIPLSRLFPGREGPIQATWYSGTLRVPQGAQILYVHMGYGSIYERELILTIEQGRVVREDVIDNTKRRLPSEDEQAEDELQKLKEWENRVKKKH